MYVKLEEAAAGFFVKNVGEKVTWHLVISMPKALLPDNLFKNKDYGAYCTNASIDHRASLEEAEKTYKELRESLTKDYEVIIVDAVLTKRK